MKTTNDLAGKIRTRSESRKEVLKRLDEKTTKLLTERFCKHRTRDGPGKEIDDFRNRFQSRMSWSIFSRLEDELIRGFAFSPERLKSIIKAANDEEKSIIEWTKNQTKILWPKWKKLIKEFKNESQERKKNGDEEKFQFKIN